MSDIRKASVLVTGGAGFIGCNLVNRLVNNFNVRVLDNLSSGTSNLSLIENKADIQIGDVTKIEECHQALEGMDYVVHLAAKGNVIESITDPVSNLHANVIGTLTLLRACESKGLKRLVFSSTGGALMGNCALPVSETSVPRPISPYGASKMACEGYLSAFSETIDLPVTILRFGNVYGRYCGHKVGVFNKILEAIQQGTKITLFNEGRASRDFVHATDICRGIELALINTEKHFDVFHLGTHKETCIAELVEIFEKAVGRSIQTVSAPARKGEVAFNFATFEQAKKVLGYSPEVTLEDGIKDLWHWYQTDQ
ncbi:MAG: NAD-dependent epimerase/dehydratase family protein [Alteromonadaceae bacterium]|nr:NAD-dependent epimerase/dehydratase family protein [Alteromonadaceae bacterium]